MTNRIETVTPVTLTSLPPLENYLEKVRDIFANRSLTNHGKNVQELENSLQQYLNAGALTLCANGTLALQLAIRLLNLNGKAVITTPYTYVATLSALQWEGCEPVFADIDPETLCISPTEVMRLLSERPDIAGVLPVHVYGNACDVDALACICAERDIALLYDAAHAMGSTLRGRSLFSWGDAATGSFHATKIFHTVEGGCIVCHQQEGARQLGLLRAFGHEDEHFICLGINAKMSELHAAMGLCLLPLLPDFLERRKTLCAMYDQALEMQKYGLQRPRNRSDLCWNHAYYPVIFPDHTALVRVLGALAKQNIYPRRYFYPSLNTLPYVKEVSCPVSEDMAQRVACLPLWVDMDEGVIDIVAQTLKSVL